MRLVVTDANVIIDLDAGGLLEIALHYADIEYCVPDVLYIEELADYYGRLPGLGLKVLPQPSDAVQYVEQLRPRFSGPSSNDLFTLALARNLGCALLSGDGALREAARVEGVELHGTIWLLEQLLTAQVVTFDQVADAYDAMRVDGSRLPWEDTRNQVLRWRGTR